MVAAGTVRFVAERSTVPVTALEIVSGTAVPPVPDSGAMEAVAELSLTFA